MKKLKKIRISNKTITEGDIIKVTRIFGFHSELMNEWKDKYKLSTINGIGSLFEGVVVFDVKRGLMLKRLDNDYAEPIFNRNQKLSCYLDFKTLTIKGNIYK